MQSPLPTLSFILLYFLFVHFAPKFMKNRAPFEMKPLLFVFNSAIVIFYVYLTREVSFFPIPRSTYVLFTFECVCQQISFPEADNQ